MFLFPPKPPKVPRKLPFIPNWGKFSEKELSHFGLRIVPQKTILVESALLAGDIELYKKRGGDWYESFDLSKGLRLSLESIHKRLDNYQFKKREDERRKAKEEASKKSEEVLKMLDMP